MQFSKEHIDESAKLINEVQPWMVFLMTLFLAKGSALYSVAQKGKFTENTAGENLLEEMRLIEALELKDTQILGMHPSNSVPLAGRLPQDKDRLLAALEKGIKARSEEFFSLARKEAPRAGTLAKNLKEKNMKNFNQSTKLCEILGVSLPIVQAPMNNVTNAALVAAVSNAGGMGVLGSNAGRDSENLNTKERYKREFERIKSLTNKPYGVNIVCRNDNDKKYALKVMETAFEAGVKAFFFVGIAETELFKFIKDNGGVLVHRALTPSANSARAAQEEGADIIIATGYDEGGVGPQNKIGTFSIVPIIADAVSVPVMAAGGINDIRGVRAAFALGASGVYVGTRFIASTECPAAQPAKESIVSMGSSELFFVSDYQRVVPSKFAKELNAMYLNGDKEVVAQKIERLNPLRLAMIDGDIENGIIYVNSGISLIKEIKSAKKIVGELMADFV